MKEVAALVMFFSILVGGYLLSTQPNQQRAHLPPLADEAFYAKLLDELSEAVNAYDSSRVYRYFPDEFTMLGEETGKFFLSVLVGLARALNTEIDLIDCSAGEIGMGCRVSIMTDLHRAAKRPPTEGDVEVAFARGLLVDVALSEDVDDDLDAASDVFRGWIQVNYPKLDATIWDDEGEVSNFIAYISWIVYWIGCQLNPAETVNCPP